VTDPPNPPRPAWHVGAAVAAWLVPGLGHLLIGQRARGLVLGTTILSLWTAGLLIGGISVIEHRDQDGKWRFWFIGQAMVAPSLPVDYVHTKLRREHRRNHHGQVPMPHHDTTPYVPAYGRAHEQGTLYTALAGLLNLLAILHVAYHQPIVPEEDEDAESDPPPHPPGASSKPNDESGNQNDE